MDVKSRVLSTIENMTTAFHRGELDGILRSYERDAVVVGEPGKPVHGDGPLRAMFGQFIEAQARFEFDGHEVVIAGDLALHLTPWRMNGRAPDGSPIMANGLSVAVLRRQPDGAWLFVIDNPYGDALLARGNAEHPQRAR